MKFSVCSIPSKNSDARCYKKTESVLKSLKIRKNYFTSLVTLTADQNFAKALCVKVGKLSFRKLLVQNHYNRQRDTKKLHSYNYRG